MEPPTLAKFLQLRTESYGLLLLVVSSMLFSSQGCFIQLAASAGVPSTEQVFIRAVFQGSLVMAAMTHLRASSDYQGQVGTALIRSPWGGSTELRGVVIARGIIGGFCFVIRFYTIAHLSLGDAITLSSLHPIITVFSAAFFLGETIRLVSVIAAAASITGAVLIARPTFLFGDMELDSTLHRSDSATSLAYLAAFVSTCCASAIFVLIRKAGTLGVHTLQLLFSWAVFGVFFSALIGNVIGSNSEESEWCVPSSPEAWKYVAGICFSGSTAHFLMNYAGRLTPAVVFSMARSCDIIWGYIWQVFIFKDTPRISTLFGVVLICASLVTIAIQKGCEREGEEEVTVESEITPLQGGMEANGSSAEVQITYGGVKHFKDNGH
uniref:EamA domain-containing protein n=1 Tax=Odontella aurita TaxID=265563 RepID=A0A7S4JP91_9STRA|mmetsp:Transcript_50703/g.152710  ORF Transcript_50703/g.152710 Transcript_50703/m.152710 type:complete len:380 (+) Transcript_50703:219-1358(+)